MILEKAYNYTDSNQKLVVFKKNGERIESKLKDYKSLIYLKLHGCINDISDVNCPLILTPDQYITHRKGRNRLFERLTTKAYEYPIIFVGYSMKDIDIRTILLEISEIKDAIPRSYIVAPDISSAEMRMWEK